MLTRGLAFGLDETSMMWGKTHTRSQLASEGTAQLRIFRDHPEEGRVAS